MAVVQNFDFILENIKTKNHVEGSKSICVCRALIEMRLEKVSEIKVECYTWKQLHNK